MKKSPFLILLLVFGTLCLNAQVADTAFASVRYTLKHIMDTTQPDNPIINKMVLYLGKNMSNYTRDNSAIAGGNGGKLVVSDVAIVNSNAGPVSVSAVPRSAGPSPFASLGNYYKDMNASKASTMQFAGGKVFSVEENIPSINWAITQEVKEILGLQCQKAIGDFKGRTYEAWFCNSLPYSNGPWKLGGLPGLIIEASDTKKEVIFQFGGYENITEKPLAIEIPVTAVRTTAKEFKQYQDALERDRQAGITNNTAAGATGGLITVRGTISGAPVGPDGKPIKLRQMNNPIEKADK
jgi:GLPGLI family protein